MVCCIYGGVTDYNFQKIFSISFSEDHFFLENSVDPDKSGSLSSILISLF